MHLRTKKWLNTYAQQKVPDIVVKKKNRGVKLLRTYIALINTKIYNMHKYTKKWLTSKYVVKKCYFKLLYIIW
jgi:hypothetical protein